MCSIQHNKVCKKNQSFNDFELEVDLQEINGVNMGRILHSANACNNVLNHIAVEMKKNVINKIIETRSKISLLIDESTSLSQLSSLIIYVRTKLPDMKEPTNIFLDIVELRGVTAETIHSTLINSLTTLGFS